MLKFLVGVVFGALMSFGYVRYNVELPAILQLPDTLRGNLISTATEDVLFDLDADKDARKRALEVYFANRAADAAARDAESGFPFLDTLHRDRAARLARQLLLAEPAFDETLSKSALRATLETKYATTQTDAIKRAMLFDALDRKPFLKRWLEKNFGAVTPENLTGVLKQAARAPQPGSQPAAFR